MSCRFVSYLRQKYESCQERRSEGEWFFLLMKERIPPVAVWSYLRQYSCERWVDHSYGNRADSSLELVAPLGERMETASDHGARDG